MHTDKNNDEQIDRIKQDSEAEGFTTNIGFQNPNSPLDLAGLDPLPESGGIGALDPVAGEDIAGEDQAHDREIASGDVQRSGRSRQITPKSEDQDESTSGGGSTSW
ncbi:MAG TPA: hypothetical protein VGD58_12600 [Herpetosiphonaceae bacterium]